MVWGTIATSGELPGNFGSAPEDTATGDCRLVALFEEKTLQAIFGVLQHYLPTADEAQNWNGRLFRQRSSSGSPRASFCEREVLYGRGRRAAARPRPIRLSR